MSDSPTAASLDLVYLARCYRKNDLRPRDVMVAILDRLGPSPDTSVWIHVPKREEILAQVEAVERKRAAGQALPLFGVPFAVKDNIDVAGQPTTSGCPAYRREAKRSNPVVERLCEAGAICIGKTNLDQFASGLAGDRSPYGAPRNVFKDEYISGGSSSGSAVAVARGLVSFALGTDTAGSGRVPAGCNNIVGLKPTPGWLSTEGMVPSSRSLDCVSFMTLTVDDARAVCDVACSGRWLAPPKPIWFKEDAGFTFAVPRDEDLEFFGDEEQKRLFGQALKQLEKMGGRRVAFDYRPFREVALLLYEGPFLAERLADLSDFLQDHADAVHPVTRSVVEGGNRFSAVDYFKAKKRLDELRQVCMQTFDQADVLAVPTMPTIPRSVDVQADSITASRHLGYYTNFVNLLGLAAIALPSGFTPQGLPGGITVIGPGGSDRSLCDLGAIWQRRLNLPMGTTGNHLPEADRPASAALEPVAPGHVRVSVAGAHLRGQPLHPDLLKLGAKYVGTSRTAPRYRFVALMNLDPPRPGLLRDDQRHGSVQVELYDLPFAGFGALVASVAPPLAIGTVELEGGESVKGFLCESFAAATGRDITDFGGWLTFRQRGGTL